MAGRPKELIVNLFLVLLIGVTSINIGQGLIRILSTTAPDFSVLYQAAQNITKGVSPYLDNTSFTAFIYPPITTILYLPFILFPYQTAQSIFVVLSFLSVFAIVFLSLKIVFKNFSLKLFILISCLTLLSFPTKFTLGMGQVNLLALLGILTSFYFYTKGAYKFTGVFLALGIVAKPILAFILLFFLFKKGWKILGITLIIGLLFFAVSIFLGGFEHYVYYLGTVLPGLLMPAGREIYYNQGLMGFISKTTDNTLARSVFGFGLSLIIIIQTMLYSLNKKNNDNALFAFFLTSLILVDSLSLQHHFVFLIFPFILALKMTDKSIIKKLYLFMSYILVAANLKNPEAYLDFPIILSHVFFGALILFFLIASDIKIGKIKFLSRYV